MNITKKTILTVLLSLAALAFVIALYVIVMGRFSAKDEPDFSSRSQGENMILNARKAMEEKQNERPMPETDLTNKTTYDQGAIKIVKDSSFVDVAERPKTQMEVLQEMAAGKNKTLVSLSEKDLDGKINLYAGQKQSEKVAVSAVPEPGNDLDLPKKSMITAPVEFKLFKEEPVWQEFAKTHKVRPVTPDFKNGYVLILVSTSDLPHGIFKIDSIETVKGETLVLYRVDPMEMAVHNPEGRYNHYSAINIPKTEKIKLKQIQ